MDIVVPKSRYEQIVRCFQQCTVLVLGDLMVDEYSYGVTRRISPEGPVMVVEVENEEVKPGGAANVVNNLLAFGARVYAAGVVGDDEAGRLLKADLAARGADVSGIITDTTRPTTRKTRILAHNQQVLRVDREQTRAVDEPISRKLRDHLEAVLGTLHLVLISDYRKGVLTPQMAAHMLARTRDADVPLMANPKPGSVRWLRGADLVSLNRKEAEDLTGQPLPDDEAELRGYGAGMRQELEVGTLVVTRGSKGLSYWRQDGEYRHVPAHPVEVYDVAGAGDTTISAMALACISGASSVEAAVIANHAGACVVRKVGVATVSPDELIADWEN
jgi:D-beta-D-heptose 7-phosphate kinase/D-beta-D-heptose 1-phosphate adenosyltransferase